MSCPRTFAASRCLVTGASSDLGKAITHRLVQEGARVILTGRSLTRLEESVADLVAQGGRAENLVVIDADLAELEGRSKIVHAVDRHFGALDLAINAARVEPTESLDFSDTETFRKTFEINLFALIELTTALFPLLQAGQDPSLVTLVAMNTQRSRPEFLASNFAVSGYTQTLRDDWASHGIHVHTLAIPTRATIPQDNPKNRSTDLDLLADQALNAIRHQRPKRRLLAENHLRHLLRRLTSHRWDYPTPIPAPRTTGERLFCW